MIRKADSVLSGRGEVVVREYVENGQVIARGEGRLRVYEDYLVNYLGYDLTDPNVQEWRIVEEFTEYEVSDLGLFRNRVTGNYVATSSKSNKNDKDSWRMRIVFVTGSGEEREMHVRKAHQVVMDAFVGEMEKDENGKNKYVVSHENDRPFDNRLVNLKYRPSEENTDLMSVNRDMIEGRLTVGMVGEVFEYLMGKYYRGSGYIAPELAMDIEDEVISDVRGKFGVGKGTIKAIYDKKMFRDGLITELEVDEEGGCYYRATDVLV